MAISFESLCEEHYERVAGAAYLVVGDRQEALDIAQETFARAYERWSQVKKMENPEGWLYRVAANLAISRRRRVIRQFRPVPVPAPDPTPEPSDPMLAAALAALTPAQRAVIVLRFFLDQSVETTAQALRKKPGTVRALTSQAVSRLRTQLGNEFLEERDDEATSRTSD